MFKHRQIYSEVAQKTGILPQDVKIILDEYLIIICRELRMRKRFNLHNMLLLSIKRRKPGVRYDVHQGKMVAYPSKDYVKVKLTKLFEDLIFH